MLDATDLAILELLQANARISNADIARKLDMAPSAILDRIRKLEQRGVIQGYITRIDAAAVGLGLTAFILVRTEERVGSGTIGKELARIPEVQELHHVAGEDCYLVKVRVPDTEGLSRLLRERFGRLKGVRNTRSTIVLSTVKETMALPLPEPAPMTTTTWRASSFSAGMRFSCASSSSRMCFFIPVSVIRNRPASSVIEASAPPSCSRTPRRVASESAAKAASSWAEAY